MILKHGTMDGSRDKLMDHIKEQTVWEECNQKKGEKRMADIQLHSPAPKRAHQDTTGSEADTTSVTESNNSTIIYHQAGRKKKTERHIMRDEKGKAGTKLNFPGYIQPEKESPQEEHSL